MKKLTSWPVLISVTVIVIASVALSIMYRLGSFKPVVIERQTKAGPYWLLTRDHLGPYHKIAAVISDVETWARTQGEPCTLTFGEYMDNPDTTDEDRLRSRGGCIISTKEKADELKKNLPEGTTVSSIEFGDVLYAVFEGSPAIGPQKVYPKAFEQMGALDLRSSGPVFEIYEILSPTQGRTRYLFPVESTRK